MSLEELSLILRYVGSFGIGAIISGVTVFYLLKSFIPTYLAEKGKLLATKEDIGNITREVEKVKSEYSQGMQELIHQNSLVLENERGHNQLRTAALERRLQAHQEAYALWRKIIRHIHNKDRIYDVTSDCQDWWENNCLYLNEHSRQAFMVAYSCAVNHDTYKQDRNNLKIAEKNFNDIIAAGKAIVEGAELPSIGDVEHEFLDDSGNIKKPNN